MEQKNSKMLITLGILVVIVVLSAFIPASWFGIKPVEKKYVKLNIPTVAVNDFKVLATDTNKDGVPEWRTLLQKTYKEGTGGQSSASSNVNATITTNDVSKADQARLEDPNNLTTSFAKNLYVATAYMKDKGVTDEKTQQEMFVSILNQEASKIIIPTYTEKDLIISSKEDAVSITAYSASIQEIAAFGSKYNIGSGDVDIVTAYTQSKNSTDLKPLSTKITRVDTLIKKMLALPVPQSAVSIHLNAINQLSRYKVTLEGLSKTDTDSVRSMLSARQYENTTRLLLETLYGFDTYFKQHAVPLTFNTSTKIPLLFRPHVIYS